MIDTPTPDEEEEIKLHIKRRSGGRPFLFTLVVFVLYAIFAYALGVGIKALLRPFLPRLIEFWWLSPQETLYAAATALIASFIHIKMAMHNVFSRFDTILHFTPLDTKDIYHQRFQETVDQLSTLVDHPYSITPVVVPSTAHNAFTVCDSKNRALLGITEGLLAHLNGQQLKGIVAQGIAMIASESSYQLTYGCALFGMTLARMAQYRDTLDQRKFQLHPKHPFYGEETFETTVRKWLLYLPYSLYRTMYRALRALISRRLHYYADSAAIDLTGNPIALSEALYLISHKWSGSKVVDPHVAALFILNPKRRAHDEQEGFSANLHSTHPPTHKRIKVLAAMARSDMRAVKDRVESDGTTASATIVASDAGDEWSVLAQGHGWAGPFTFNDLKQSALINPETWLKNVETGEMIQAKENPMFAECYQQEVDEGELTGLNCPHCREKMAKTHLEGIEIQRCRFCQGTLVSEAKMRRLLARGTKKFEERIARLGEIALAESRHSQGQRFLFLDTSYVQCSQCQRKMEQQAFSNEFIVMIDRCTSCELGWYDKDEVEMLQYMAYKKNEA